MVIWGECGKSVLPHSKGDGDCSPSGYDGFGGGGMRG